MVEKTLNQIDKEIGTVVVMPVKLERAQLYLSKELRENLKWKTEERLTAIVSYNVLILFREEDYSSLIEAINKVIEKLSEIKKKI